ncbi:hypothetical protein [Spartinivicinus poritis]|uniref:Uncharacterized protein n=1 Tax=Spartinivicinus poritis TaxID=2994640 RepID=A0ABT5UG18_9GAMM|nr:hypothetical protein [Spartinivicinus sp. A2-2]MDE1465319.1 hypothetical protein [Spartinivicinus sp. A2-2]
MAPLSFKLIVLLFSIFMLQACNIYVGSDVIAQAEIEGLSAKCIRKKRFGFHKTHHALPWFGISEKLLYILNTKSGEERTIRVESRNCMVARLDEDNFLVLADDDFQYTVVRLNESKEIDLFTTHQAFGDFELVINPSKFTPSWRKYYDLMKCKHSLSYSFPAYNELTSKVDCRGKMENKDIESASFEMKAMMTGWKVFEIVNHPVEVSYEYREYNPGRNSHKTTMEAKYLFTEEEANSIFRKVIYF